MKDEKGKLEPPLHLGMPFGEALERYIHTDPEEVEPAKGKKAKGLRAAKRSSSASPPTSSEIRKQTPEA
jgi:hypothetical protein